MSIPSIPKISVRVEKTSFHLICFFFFFQLESKLQILRDSKQKLNEHITQYDSAIDTASSTGSLPAVDDIGPLANGRNDMDILSSRATVS